MFYYYWIFRPLSILLVTKFFSHVSKLFLASVPPQSSGFDHIYWTEISPLLSTSLLPLLLLWCLGFHRARCWVLYCLSCTLLHFQTSQPVIRSTISCLQTTSNFKNQLKIKFYVQRDAGDCQRELFSLNNFISSFLCAVKMCGPRVVFGMTWFTTTNQPWCSEKFLRVFRFTDCHCAQSYSPRTTARHTQDERWDRSFTRALTRTHARSQTRTQPYSV